MVGRQADVVVLSDADRSLLESQVRRHKAPRSLSDRCRMILLCAQGLQSKDVAERLGVHE
ncbi:IS630 family transposase, partial [Mesorhizobium abyssinicae]